MRKLIAGLAAIGLIAGACSDGDDSADDTEATTDDTEATTDNTTADNTTDGDPGETTGDTATDSTVAGTTDASVAETTVPEDEALPLTGVDGNTIKIVFPAKMEPCGDSEEVANANVITDGGMSALGEFVAFFNDEVLADSGYVLEHEFVDDGGVDCPEKARAAGRQIVEEIQPFAVIGPSQNVEGPILADMVTAAGIRHVGLSWNTIAAFEERAPYAFTIVNLAETSMLNLVDYIEKRVDGTPGRDPETGDEVAERRYGYVTMDLPEYHDIVDSVSAKMSEAGIELEQTYFVSTDPAVAGQNAATLVTKMAEDGVNTLIFDFFNTAGFASGSALTQTMATQNYRPDILVGTKGLAAIFGPLWEPTVWEHAQGISYFSTLALRAALVANDDGTFGFDPAYADINENIDPVEQTWEHLGHTDDLNVAAVGADAHNRYYGLAMVALGLMHAEGDLTATSWLEGLGTTATGEPNRCDMGRFHGGRDTDYSPNVSYGPGDYDGAIDKFTTVHWVSEPTDIGLPGRWESYDNYQFVDSMDELPDEPSHDTSVTPPDIPLQEEVGLHAWTTCEEVGLP